MKQEQDAIFDACSEIFNELSREFNERAKHYLNHDMFGDSIGAVCLDIGNGGQAPEEILSETNRGHVTTFVGLDYNHKMLRHTAFQHRIQANALALPFASTSCDTVIARGVIHHLGVRADEPRTMNLHRLFEEMRRVVKPSGTMIVFEVVMPRWLEWVQLQVIRSVFFTLLRKPYVPICMYSRRAIAEVIARQRVQVLRVDYQPLRRFTRSYFEPFIAFWKFPWLKLPVFCQPHRYATWVLRAAP